VFPASGAAASDPAIVADTLPPRHELALFLDVDGTLIGPEHADRERGLTDEQLALLEQLMGMLDGALTILTGRAIEAVDGLFAPLVLPAGGLQGSDRRFADGRRVMPVLSAQDRRLFETMAEAMARDHPTIEIEWKPAGMALVHGEGSPEAGALVDLARSIMGTAFEVMPGRVATDIVPPGVDKGHALEAFMERRPCVGRVPVHVGDERPDEPAFRAAWKAGGYGITVGRTSPGVMHHLTDHVSVWALLEAYADRTGLR
jgi:trehalose 6-phosphate phosphatase